MKEHEPTQPDEDAEDAYDRFLEAALRGEIPADDDGLTPPDDAPEAVREAVRGLRRVLRGEGRPRHDPEAAASGLPFETAR